MNTKHFKLSLIFFISLTSFNVDAQLAGKAYNTSECASGGFDYYFFENNVLIAKYYGAEYEPFIISGTYEASKSKVWVHIKNEWYGKGIGDIVHVSSINHYNEYVARKASSNESFSIEYEWFNSGIEESCEEIGTHNYKIGDPHYFLRNGLEGQ